MNHRVETISNYILRHFKMIHIKVIPVFTVYNSFVTVSVAQQPFPAHYWGFMLIVRKGPCSFLMYNFTVYTLDILWEMVFSLIHHLQD